LAPRSLKALLRGRDSRPRGGEAGEALACRHLERLGFVVLARNFRCRVGEIDIVARDGDQTVFVEVKERSSDTHGSGFDAVTRTKRQRVIKAARLYAASRGLSDSPLRFDVISIDRNAPDAERALRHDRGAFDSEGF
jgi:putative endonuclease